VRRVPAKRIEEEHHFSPNTISDWGQFCKETMLVYVHGCSEKIGGPDKTVEVDESELGRRKYDRETFKGLWVFGGVERDSGRTFFVPFSDRTTNTLMAVIDSWIVPGTTVISDCWGAHHNVEEQGYTHLTINQSVGFVDPHTGVPTNRIESCGKHPKVFVKPYNRKKDYIYDMVHYMFAAKCRAENVDQFTKFLHLIATTGWSLPAQSSSAFT
jgi:hypothetical protein